MAALHAAAFWCAALIFLARTPYVLRNPRGRPAWGATGVGALGLLTLGSVVPQDVLDGWLGGSNLINLLQNVCATAAFWLMLRASTADLERRPLLARPLALAVVVAAFAVPFFLVQDRGGTDFHFIVRGIDQTAMWLYASVYMAGVAAITLTTLRYGMLGSRRAVVVFRVGLALVTAASVEEVLSLTADHFSLATAPVRDALRFWFDPPFYLGIVLLVVAMASLTTRRWGRDLRCRQHERRLARVAARHGITARRRPDAPRSDAGQAGAAWTGAARAGASRGSSLTGDARTRTYDLVIALRDAEVQGRQLSADELDAVRSAERTLTRDLG